MTPPRYTHEQTITRLEARIAELEEALEVDPEEVGSIVRLAWIGWAKTQPDPKASWLTEWQDMEEKDREADRRIGVAVAKFIKARGAFKNRRKAE